MNVFDIRQSFDISDVKFFIGDLCKMEVIIISFGHLVISCIFLLTDHVVHCLEN